MDATPSDYDATLSRLGYEVYVETLLALRHARCDPREELVNLKRDVITGTCFERRALMLALSDFLRHRPLRSAAAFESAFAVEPSSASRP